MFNRDKYLIWSNMHSAWWRPNGGGYTIYPEEAGEYSRKEATDIAGRCRDGMARSSPTELPVLKKDLMLCLKKSPRGKKHD